MKMSFLLALTTGPLCGDDNVHIEHFVPSGPRDVLKRLFLAS